MTDIGHQEGDTVFCWPRLAPIKQVFCSLDGQYCPYKRVIQSVCVFMCRLFLSMAEPYTLLMSDVGHQECVTIPTAIGNQEGETCEPCSYRCLGTTSCLGIGCCGVCVRDFSRGIRDLPVQTDGRTDIVALIPFPSNKGFRRQKNIDKGQSQVHPRQFMMRNT
jgi:hypothetical protein